MPAREEDDDRRLDDADDRPRRRRRLDDDDDDRDRPRRRAKSGPSGLLIGLIIGAVALIGLCVVGGLIGLLLPAVEKVREAAARAKEQNNMKQVALAVHSFADVHGGGMSAPYAIDEKGAVLRGLSHRVSLLPYIEQQNLYQQFDKKQPWDAAGNRAAANTVIPTYTTPLDPPGTTTTPFRAFVGGGALFNEDGSPVPFGQVKDGTSNTLMFVHAREQVAWAQPKDLPYGPRAPLPPLGHASLPAVGANVAFADGSVRVVKPGVPEATLRALITRAGNEPVPADF